jgi:hypothetical protein
MLPPWLDEDLPVHSLYETRDGKVVLVRRILDEP